VGTQYWEAASRRDRVYLSPEIGFRYPHGWRKIRIALKTGKKANETHTLVLTPAKSGYRCQEPLVSSGKVAAFPPGQQLQ
jgi:hypothetical protein